MGICSLDRGLDNSLHYKRIVQTSMMSPLDLISADLENSWPWTTEKARLLPYLHCVYGYFDGMPLWNDAILLRLHPLLAESKQNGSLAK